MKWNLICHGQINFIFAETRVIPIVPAYQDANPPVQAVAATEETGATFQISNAKLYVPVVTLSINDNVICLKNIKQEFKRTIY